MNFDAENRELSSIKNQFTFVWGWYWPSPNVAAIQQNQIGAFLCGVGIFGFGVHWFLQPLVLGKREGAKRLVYENARLGSVGLRKTVEYYATGALLAGMILRYGFHI